MQGFVGHLKELGFPKNSGNPLTGFNVCMCQIGADIGPWGNSFN